MAGLLVVVLFRLTIPISIPQRQQVSESVVSAVCNNSQTCDSNLKTLRPKEHFPDSAKSQLQKLILPMSVIGKF